MTDLPEAHLPTRWGTVVTAWWTTQAALAGVGLWTFHVFLMKRHLDRPLILGTALGAIFVLGGTAAWLTRRAPDDAPLPMRRWWRSVGRQELVFLALFLAFLFVSHWEFQRARVDGRAYFAQVRSFVIDFDADFSNENRDFAVQGSADHFASGVPFLWIPFFVAAHLWLAILNLFGGGYSLSGYFNPYQRAVGLGTTVYGVLGLVLIQRLVSRYFSKTVATIATVGVCLGSFVAWYLSIDVSYAHGVSMFTTTLFVYYWDTTRARSAAPTGGAGLPPTPRGERAIKEWVILGALAGIMAMVRWQNLLFVVIPAGEAVLLLWRASVGVGGTADSAKESPAPRDMIRELLLRYGAFAGALVLGFFPQMIVWKVNRGSWFDMPDEVHPISWMQPDPVRELFSSDRGLFAWTPLLLFAIIGLFIFARRERLFGTLLIAAFAAQVYISSTILSVGHGPGARKFTNCAIIFCIGLAALLDWLRRRPLAAPALGLAALIVVNIAFNADMRTTDLEQHSTVPAARILEATTSRLGNPFTLPINAWVAWRYGVTLSSWERLGSQTYNNLRIDLGAPGDDKFLGHGWAEPEGDPELSFRWSVGAESTLLAPLKESDRYAIEIRARAFSFDGAPAQIIEVWINGEMAGRLPIGRELDWHRLIIDRDFIKSGLNGIRLRYRYAESPSSLGISDDSRLLAVQFDQLNLIRNPR